MKVNNYLKMLTFLHFMAAEHELISAGWSIPVVGSSKKYNILCHLQLNCLRNCNATIGHLAHHQNVCILNMPSKLKVLGLNPSLVVIITVRHACHEHKACILKSS